MKQIITLLLVILVSIPANAQFINQKNQELENLKTVRLTEHKETSSNMFSNYQNRNLLLKKKTAFLKTLETKYLDSLIYQEKIEGSNFWRNTIKKVFTYENDIRDKIAIYNWDIGTSSWDPTQNIDFTYDESGKLVKVIKSTKISPIQWTSQKIEYFYIPDSSYPVKLEYEIHSSWDTTVSQWVNTYKHELIYESDGSFVIMENSYQWNEATNQWVNLSKHEYFPRQYHQDYDIISNWNVGTSQWDPVSKREYSRGDFHPWVPDFVILLNWENSSGGHWANDFKYEYEYDFGGPDAFPRQTRVTGSYWDTSTNQWKKDYKDDYVYDWWESSDQSSTSIYYEWDESKTGWEPLNKDEFIFDFIDWNDDVISALGYEFDDAPTFTYYLDLLIGFRNYEFINAVWVNKTRSFLYYSNYNNLLDVEEELLADHFKLYPNPVNDILNLETKKPITKVEIYSILGKKLMEINSGFNSISLSNLTDGIYLVKINADNKFLIKKIIKTSLIY